MKAFIKAIEYHLPETVLDNQRLAAEFLDWSAEKIKAKTGIDQRHIAKNEECASDLGVVAAQKLLESGAVSGSDIDYLILCTQSPDYFLPTTACLIQNRLGLSKNCGALDINLGCSGFVYGLGLAKGLIETGQASNVLLITAETYSKHIHPADKSVRTLFGDAAAATLVSAMESPEEEIGPFIYGTDGSGALNLIVPTGGMRKARVADAPVRTDESNNQRTENDLFMNGAEIFNFTLRIIPPLVQQLLENSKISHDQIDLWVFHQANQFMLEHIRKKIGVSREKFVLSFAGCGNTVSSTIPIALKNAALQGQMKPGYKVALIGFGVGYSWAGTVMKWRGI
ncbi:MAG: ketoacyl-ACP synthase III [Verrucomicrobiota bacterium]